MAPKGISGGSGNARAAQNMRCFSQWRYTNWLGPKFSRASRFWPS
jgi:hypothetical protein